MSTRLLDPGAYCDAAEALGIPLSVSYDRVAAQDVTVVHLMRSGSWSFSWTVTDESLARDDSYPRHILTMLLGETWHQRIGIAQIILDSFKVAGSAPCYFPGFDKPQVMPTDERGYPPADWLVPKLGEWTIGRPAETAQVPVERVHFRLSHLDLNDIRVQGVWQYEVVSG